MKKNLMLLILTIFALVGCGGGGSHSEPLLKQPQANTMSVPEYKALNAKDVKSTNTKLNVTTGTNSNTYETKDYKTFKPTIKITDNFNISDTKLSQVIINSGEVAEHKGNMVISRIEASRDMQPAPPVAGLSVKPGGKLYNTGTITLIGKNPKLITKQVGMYAVGYKDQDSFAINMNKIVVETDKQTGMEAQGKGAVVINYGTIDLNGVSQTAMYALDGGTAVNHGTINLNGSKGVGLKSDKAGLIINAKDGIIILSGQSKDTATMTKYKDYNPILIDNKGNFGFVNLDKGSNFVNHGTIKLK